MLRSLFLATVLLCGLTGSAAAQQNQLDEPRQVTLQDSPAPQALMNLRGFSSDYQVGPGDLLDIRVIGHDDLRESLRVSNSGEIGMAMVGLVKVLEMTTFEVEDEIAKRLREAGLVLKPEVLVAVQEYQAKPVYVMGAVVTPGEFIMSQALTVPDAILLAGGLRFNAADEALLHRRPDGSTVSPAALAANPGAARAGVEVIKIDLKPLKEGKFDEFPLPLRRGDVLVVPDLTLKQFFVVGEVLDPRNFLYTPGRTLMASQAIAWAGGPTKTAKMSEGMLVRFGPQGQRTELKVDFAAVLAGRQQDFPIQPDDLIFVPGSAVKTIAQGMLLLTDTMVMSASFRVARSYQMPDAPPRPTGPQQE
jgi:protein involved in polysaccharide export with SLBB domain